jgi:hypothetical protein
VTTAAVRIGRTRLDMARRVRKLRFSNAGTLLISLHSRRPRGIAVIGKNVEANQWRLRVIIAEIEARVSLYQG